MISSAILRECERLAPALAPELGQAPLYAVNFSGPDAPESVAAYVPSYTDFRVRDALQRYRRWEGPGTTVVFCHPMTREEALGLMLHEVAHALPFAPPCDDREPTADERDLQRQHVVADLNTTSKVDGLPAWYPHHGSAFIRTCLHLHARAWTAGHEIGLPAVHFAGPDYDLGAPWRYMRALGDEPRRMRDASFAEILSTPAPAEFIDLFRSDVREWSRRQTKARKEIAA